MARILTDDPAWLDIFSLKTYTANYSALEFLDPSTARRTVFAPLNRDDIQPILTSKNKASANIEYQKKFVPLYFGEDPIVIIKEQIESIIPKNAKSVLLIGLGLGYYLEALLEHVEKDCKIWVFEPDYLWLQLTLSRIDLTEPFMNRQIKLICGLGWFEKADRIPKDTFILEHKGLEPLIRWDKATVEKYLERAKTAPAVDKKHKDKKNKRTLITTSDLKNVPKRYRICVLSAELLYESTLHGFFLLDHDVFHVDYKRYTWAELKEEFLRLKPDIVFSINIVEGIGGLCSHLEIPYVVWEIDPRSIVAWSPKPHESQFTHIFTYRKQHVTRYPLLGFKWVDYLPLATTSHWRCPLPLTEEDVSRYFAPISFVGASLLLGDLHDREITMVNEHLQKSLANCKTDGERALYHEIMLVMQKALHLQSANLMRPILIEYLDYELGRMGISPELEIGGYYYDLRIIFSRIFGSKRRLTIVSALSNFGIVVYGDPYWKEILPANIPYKGFADYGWELTKIYNASCINLDIGRLYQLDIVTLRVFDIVSSGGFILVENSEGLSDLFEIGKEIVAYSTIDELKELSTFYLSNLNKRLDCIEAGLARVKKDHTVEKRLKDIITTLEKRGAIGKRNKPWSAFI